MRSLSAINEAAARHMEAGTTDLGEKVITNPVSSYLQTSVFESELINVIRNRPIAIVASSSLKKAGDYFAAEIAETPVVAVKGQDHKIRIFLNVCRHRGAQLVKEGSGSNLEEFTCPFHGWSYRQTGELFKIPEIKKCFASGKMDGHGLVELKSIEFAGMVWALLDKNSDFDLSEAVAPVLGDFSELKVDPKFAMEEFTRIGRFNWKIGVEAFLEVDHFPFAHAPYLSNLEFPSLSLGDFIGKENLRIVVPLKKPTSGEFLLNWAQVMYFIFPSSFLLFYSDHVAFISLTPMGIDRTLFRYIPLVPNQTDLENTKIQQKADFLKVIIQQDLDILEGIQKGLKSSSNSHHVFTLTEHALARFHANLKK